MGHDRVYGASYLHQYIKRPRADNRGRGLADSASAATVGSQDFGTQPFAVDLGFIAVASVWVGQCAWLVLG